MNLRLLQKAINTIFFGNVFIGFCAVALCIETNFQHGLALNHFQFYKQQYIYLTYYPPKTFHLCWHLLYLDIYKLDIFR